MASENGNGYWVKWLVGILWGGVTAVILLIGNNVIANEKASILRDEKIEDKLTKAVIEQKDINQNILIALTEIKSDLKYIKQK